MKRLFIYSVIVTVVFIGCQTTANKDWKQKSLQDTRNQLKKLESFSEPLIDKDYPLVIQALFSSNPNTANGVSVRIIYFNITSRPIKYINFTVTPYNRVNDVVSCSITKKTDSILQVTGPIEPGLEKVPTDKDGLLIINDHTGYWKNVWYNSTIDHIDLKKVKITYMDNSTKEFNKQQCTEMILPKGFYKK